MAFKLSDRIDPERRREMRERQEERARELSRLHALPDRWLGEELLKLARTAREEMPDRLGNPADFNYDTNFVWQIVPEAAKRLGATGLRPNEATQARVVEADDTALRRMTGQYLGNMMMGRFEHEARKAGRDGSACGLLAHEFVNGNPVAMAMDRIADPDPEGADRDDWLARHMREISRNRFGDTRFDRWAPEFQDYPRNGAIDFNVDDIVDEVNREAEAREAEETPEP